MMEPSDPLGWAKQPRSRQVVERVHRLAETDRRFRAIRERLQRDGVIDPHGRPLALWEGAQWVPVARAGGG